MPSKNLGSRLSAVEKAVAAAGPRRGEAELAAAWQFEWDDPLQKAKAILEAMALKHGDAACEQFQRNLRQIYGHQDDLDATC